MSIYDVFSGGNKPYDKAEWAAQKQAERKEAYEMIDTTCSEMMTNGDSFRQYLDVQGRFDRYSVNNAILVSAQMPEAEQLKDKAGWKANRVYVNKDAQRITILEPSKEYTCEDGTKAISYNAKAVYDISETSAKDRTQAQEPKSMRELVSAMIDASPVPFQPMDNLELPAFYDSGQQTIFIRTGLNEEQLLSVWQKRWLRQSLTLSIMKAVMLLTLNPTVLPIWSVPVTAWIPEVSALTDCPKSMLKWKRRILRVSLALCVTF